MLKIGYWQETTLTRDECIKLYGGFTELDCGWRFIIEDEGRMPRQPVLGMGANYYVLTGYEQGPDGCDTGFTLEHVREFLKPNPLLSEHGPHVGGWLNDDGHLITEPVTFIACSDGPGETTPWNLATVTVLAERLRKHLRQQSVLILEAIDYGLFRVYLLEEGCPLPS